MALGATRPDMARLILGEVVHIAAAGLALGLATALLVSQLAESLLFGVQANDPPVLTLPRA